MSKTLALVVAGILFTLIALAHLLRVIYKFEITVAGWAVPQWVSVIAIFVTLILALWMFIASKA